MKKRMISCRLASLCLVIVAVCGRAGLAATVYVDATATGPAHDGTSWCNAFLTLDAALTGASSGDIVRLAAGVYVPDGTGLTEPRSASFRLVEGVVMEGGFAGCASPTPDARDVQLFETILSGDVNGDDGPAYAGNAENVYHVIRGTALTRATVLDGLTITAGHADGNQAAAMCFGGDNNGQPCTIDGDCAGTHCVGLDNVGAGMTLDGGSSPTLLRCTIRANYALFQGGGMMAKSGASLLTGCVFEDNFAGDNGGAIYLKSNRSEFVDCDFSHNVGGVWAGAICLRDYSEAVFTDCRFTSNDCGTVSPGGGGAIVNASSSPTLTRCTFTGNRAFSGLGGAVYNTVGFGPGKPPSEPIIIDSQFIANWGIRGGAIYGIDGTVATVQNCAFRRNATTTTDTSGINGSGAAIYVTGSTLNITGSSFEDNTFTRFGTVYITTDSTASITNSTFLRNVGNGDLTFTDGSGVGVYVFASMATITGCTFADNIAKRYGGAIVCSKGGGTFGGTVTIRSCNFLRNSAGTRGGAIDNAFLNTLNIVDCLFEENSASGQGGALGLLHVDSPVTVVNSVFRRNTAGNTGGAIFLLNAPALTAINTVFEANATSGNGGAISISNASATISQCTFYANTHGTAKRGSTIALDSFQQASPGAVTISNTIVWDDGGPIWNNDQSQVVVTASDVLGGWPGSGNIDILPQFVDMAAGDLRLSATSPCIDAGTLAMVPSDLFDLDGDGNSVERLPYDLAGNPRIGGGLVDMGAYEFLAAPLPQPPIPTVSAWGLLLLFLLTLTAGTIVIPRRLPA